MHFGFRYLIASGFLLVSFAAQSQVYALFGSHLEKEYDPRSFKMEDITPDLPACKRNDAAWWAQVKDYERKWNDPRRLNETGWWSDMWADTAPHFDDWPQKFRKPPASTPKGAAPQFGPAQGVTWIDIDGDGWCDVVLSVWPEAAKRPGLPIILAAASSLLFFDPASKTFKTGVRGQYFAISRGGEITSAFTFYYNRKARRVETVERIFSSGMFYSSTGWEELHGRLMLKGALLTEPLCNKAGVESEPCIAYTHMNEEYGRVVDGLHSTDPREAAIRQRLMKEFEKEPEAPPKPQPEK